MNHVWKIYNLKRKIADGMVTDVTWACESELDGDGTRTIGDVILTTGSSSDPSFVNYGDLNESIVLGWVDSEVSKSDIESGNSASIAHKKELKKGITEANGLPW